MIRRMDKALFLIRQKEIGKNSQTNRNNCSNTQKSTQKSTQKYLISL
jgi:hypothetical protein